MDSTFFGTAAIAALCVCIGAGRLIAWFFDRREADAARAIREAQLIAQASAHAREIEASKRGDLVAAAAFAEIAEGTP